MVEEPQDQRTPIIAMAANAWINDCESWIAAGMDDCMVKPFTMEDITKIFRSWLPRSVQA